jgi:hypothetical protein
MKKLILSAVLAFSLNVSAQIEEVKKEKSNTVGIVGTQENFCASLKFLPKEDLRNFYFITYKNQYFKTLSDYQTLSFYATESDLNNLYSIVEDLVVNGENKASKDLKIGKTDLILMKSKENVYFFIDKYNYFTLSLTQLKQLFNKQ